MPKSKKVHRNGVCTGRITKRTDAVSRIVKLVSEHHHVGKISFSPITTGLRCGNGVVVKVSKDTNCISLTVIQQNSKQFMFVFCSSVDETCIDIEAMLRNQPNMTVKSA